MLIAARPQRQTDSSGKEFQHNRSCNVMNREKRRRADRLWFMLTWIQKISVSNKSTETVSQKRPDSTFKSMYCECKKNWVILHKIFSQLKKCELGYFKENKCEYAVFTHCFKSWCFSETLTLISEQQRHAILNVDHVTIETAIWLSDRIRYR